jgi:uncharacterized membrane protein
MFEFLAVRKFIYSTKNLNNYIKKSTSTELLNLLHELTLVTNITKKRKNDKNPSIRELKCNLSEEEYVSLMNKLEIFPYEDRILTFTNKEILLHFAGTLTVILFGSFSGFIGLLAALGIVFSIGTLSLLLATVGIFSLLIAFIWNYQARITNHESKENKKLLNLHVEVLKNYNFNKLNKISLAINSLKEKLGLNYTQKITCTNVMESSVISLIANDLVIIKEACNDSSNTSSNLAKSSQKIRINESEWKQRLNNLSNLFNFQTMDMTFESIKNGNNPADNPGFFQWFKTDTSRILLKVFNTSKNLLASLALGASIGLATLKLMAEIALLNTLFTTQFGLAILIGIITVVVISAMIFTIYDMYKHSKRSNINSNTHRIIESEQSLKEKLEGIEKELDNLLFLASNSAFDSLSKIQDTIFMEELISQNSKKNKWTELQVHLTKKNLRLIGDAEKILNTNPLLILKLIKKLKDDIILNDAQLKDFFQGNNRNKLDVPLTQVAKNEMLDDENSTQRFNQIKPTIAAATDDNLIFAITYIEKDLSQKKPYWFIETRSKEINNVAKETASRLNNLDNSNHKINLRKFLEPCKNFRKQVLSVLLDEHIKLQDSFNEYIAILKSRCSHSRDKHVRKEEQSTIESKKQSDFLDNTLEATEYTAMKQIKKSLKFDPHTVTINELISKKQAAGSSYKENSKVTEKRNCFNFWQQPYRQNQKVAETFAQIGVKLR